MGSGAESPSKYKTKPKASIYKQKRSPAKKKSAAPKTGYEFKPLTREEVFQAMEKNIDPGVQILDELQDDIKHTKEIRVHFERKRKSFRYRWAEWTFDIAALRRDSYKAWKYSHLGAATNDSASKTKVDV